MNYWDTPLQIKNLSIPRFIGGPLDGITDSPFRQLVRDFSKKEFLFTEMRHVACIANDKTGRLSMKFEQFERPLIYQVAACELRFIQQACEKVLAQGVDIIDLNIGCPAPNVTKSGAGSALMANLPQLKAVVQTLRQHIPIPFTVKMRAGYKQKNAVDVALLLQDCGVDAITIHPRLQPQLFSGRPDYPLAAEVKRRVQIPVLLSGNVVNWHTARMAYEQTGVDGFLIGRGIWSKPWKLHELREHVAGRPFTPSRKLIFSYAYKHLEKMLEYYGNPRGLFAFRKHLSFYLRGFPDASALRQELVTSEDAPFVQAALERLYQTETDE